jgi:hypothetical protein
MNYYFIYFPYNVSFNTFKWNQNNQTVLNLENLQFAVETKQKLVLKPIKSIINEIDGFKKVAKYKNPAFQDSIYNLEYALKQNYEDDLIAQVIENLPYIVVIELIEKHYDVFNLITTGQVIDINLL